METGIAKLAIGCNVEMGVELMGTQVLVLPFERQIEEESHYHENSLRL